MLEFSIFSRAGCHLCDIMHRELESLCDGRARIAVIDIDSRADWQARYGQIIPVLSCDGEEICRYRLNRQAVIDRLNKGMVSG